VKYLGVWMNASLKDDDIQRQVKSLYCAQWRVYAK